MNDDGSRKNYGGTSGNRYDMNDEQRAKEQAYREYLRLRENSSGNRGHYVKDDTLYGAYFPSSGNGSSSGGGGGRSSGRTSSGYEGSSRDTHAYTYRDDSRSSSRGSSIDDTPYGNSEMRRKRQREEEARRQYMEEREGGRREVAKQGRKNSADSDKLTRAEKKAMKKKNGGGGKKSGRGLKIALLVMLILVIGIGGVIAAGLTVVKNTLDNVGRIELDPDMIGINPQVDSELRNYRNIALLGIDARDMSSDEGVRSDAIIVVSINKETGEIKMFSVYRDTMLDLGEDVGTDKVTHAYYYGGPTKVLYALNKNLDLNIKEVVVVNWKSVADTVDALGGLDIEIQESEINEMNKYIQDTYDNIGGSDKMIESAGMQTLNGNQAVTYARIRKDAATGDFRRNERMKIVVQAAFEKAKTMDLKTLRNISEDILPDIKTNMSSGDMMSMMMDITSYNMTDSVGWPYEHKDWSSGAYYNIAVTLAGNVTQLHEQFFGQEGYDPTQDVHTISEEISYKTGFY